ncbi:hypothetical protein [Alteromonas macleodii]|uniref:Lipoprotein n=1 Tax=Alteromonas macleodii TaxID=28108 RepID=A0AB36FS63_ALTMA|nr:hypothetical protein [Alteromonas macleodii]OES24204.1 putative lipoprotein [Alteromonas macleodii]OES24836.1 putative lipoprotein [Alteromonas macleodii]OES25114.1 putative lipoprotein [Alteromonas macleodii]OES39157.1 putative lipoprotein [Alteromonas macleodii]
MKIRTHALPCFVVLLLSACGGSSSNDEPDTPPPPPAPVVTTETGMFFAGKVSGIRYASGTTGGTIDDSGQYEYQVVDGVAQPISFSIAGIDLGSTLGKAFITPVDLADGGTAGSTAVVNRVTLLRLLAENPTSTIDVIPDQRLLDNETDFAWPQPDFSATDFANSVEMVQIVGDINAFLATQKTVPSSAESEVYLRNRLYCAASGIYYGDIEGGDTGHVAFGLNPLDGSVTTVGWSDGSQNIIFIQEPSFPVFSSTIDFETGAALSGDVFNMTISNYLDIEGTWTNSNTQTEGTYSGTLLDRDYTADYHFTAAYIALFPVFGPGPAGSYSFNLYADGTVTGSQVNITFGDTTTTPITGVWNGNLMSAQVEGGATINAAIDFATMTMFGEWDDPNAPITSGGVTGTGCRFN